MKHSRIRYILSTLPEIMGGWHALGSPLAKQLLQCGPATLDIDLLAGPLGTVAIDPTLAELAQPFIDFLHGERRRDRGAPHLAAAVMQLDLGPATTYADTTTLRRGGTVQRHANGDAYREYETRALRCGGQEYTLTMRGHLLHGTVRHDFAATWTPRIEQWREAWNP